MMNLFVGELSESSAPCEGIFFCGVGGRILAPPVVANLKQGTNSLLYRAVRPLTSKPRILMEVMHGSGTMYLLYSLG